MSSNPQGNSSTTQENEHLFTDDGLTRKLGLSTAIAICIGTTVGSGIFSSIGEIANASGSALFIALSFFLGGLYQIPASLFYAELYSAYPVNGGIYKNFEMAGCGVQSPLSPEQLSSSVPILPAFPLWRSPLPVISAISPITAS